MKRKLAGIAAIGLSFMMAVVYMPSTSFAASKADKVSGADQAAVQNVEKAIEQSENTDIYDYVTGDSGSDEKFPDAYDLSSGKISGIADAKDVITSVKFQNPYGTCWGFAAIAAAEGSIISEAVANGENLEDTRDAMNLSEKHLAWFARSCFEDESDSQYGEGTHWKDGLSSSSRYQGGDYALASGLFSSGAGPVSETRDDVPENLFKYMGAKGEITSQQTLDKTTGEYKTIPYCYSNEDDWSIPAEYRNYQSYKLEQSFVLPSPAGYDEDGNYEYNEAGTNAIKEELTQGRPVAIGFHADSATPNSINDGTYIDTTNWAHYTYTRTSANHGVTVVGYDDNYPKENFIQGHQPPGDGAFLVKNSWGSSDNIFPNKGASWGIDGSGYFWISYYDRSLTMVESFDFDYVHPGDAEYILDQYDYCNEENPINMTSKTEEKSSNIFTAEYSQKLFSVGCQTSVPNTEVTYQIYILPSNASDPEDGYLAKTVTETYRYGGYHKCNLDEDIIIQKGQKYSIVVTQKMPNDQYAVFMNGVYSKAELEKHDITDFWETAVVNKGESYLYQNGSWTDFSDVASAIAAEENQDEEIELDNFPIKGYATECEQNTQMRADVTSLDYNYRDQVATVGISFKGEELGEASDSITWESTDDNVITLSPYTDKQGRDRNSIKQVTSVGVGTAYIYVKNPDLGMVVIKCTVPNPGSVKFASAEAVTNGIYVQWTKDSAAEHYHMTYGPVGGKMEECDIDSANYDSKKYGSATIKSPVKYKTYKITICSRSYKYDGEKYTPVDGDGDTIYVTQKPATGKIKSVSRLSKGIKVQWYKRTCTGYQVQYSLNKSMKNAKTKTYAKAATTSCKITGLKASKRYYVRVRAYSKATGSVSYGNWSTIKSVKTK